MNALVKSNTGYNESIMITCMWEIRCGKGLSCAQVTFKTTCMGFMHISALI